MKWKPLLVLFRRPQSQRKTDARFTGIELRYGFHKTRSFDWWGDRDRDWDSISLTQIFSGRMFATESSIFSLCKIPFSDILMNHIIQKQISIMRRIRCIIWIKCNHIDTIRLTFQHLGLHEMSHRYILLFIYYSLWSHQYIHNVTRHGISRKPGTWNRGTTLALYFSTLCGDTTQKNNLLLFKTARNFNGGVFFLVPITNLILFFFFYFFFSFFTFSPVRGILMHLVSITKKKKTMRSGSIKYTKFHLHVTRPIIHKTTTFTWENRKCSRRIGQFTRRGPNQKRKRGNVDWCNIYIIGEDTAPISFPTSLYSLVDPCHRSLFTWRTRATTRRYYGAFIHWFQPYNFIKHNRLLQSK